MGWKNYGFVATVRGLTAAERNVFWYLADEADGRGYIEALRISRLSRMSETPRRRLFQILHSIETKGFMERTQRQWDKPSKTAVPVKKGEKLKGRQLSSGYRLRFDRFFPINGDPSKWAAIRSALEKKLEVGIFRVYILGIKQTYFVKRTGQLCLLAHSKEHKHWLETEVLRTIIEIGVDLKPPVLSVEIFYPPKVTDTN